MPHSYNQFTPPLSYFPVVGWNTLLSSCCYSSRVWKLTSSGKPSRRNVVNSFLLNRSLITHCNPLSLSKSVILVMIRAVFMIGHSHVYNLFVFIHISVDQFYFMEIGMVSLLIIRLTEIANFWSGTCSFPLLSRGLTFYTLQHDAGGSLFLCLGVPFPFQVTSNIFAAVQFWFHLSIRETEKISSFSVLLVLFYMISSSCSGRRLWEKG